MSVVSFIGEVFELLGDLAAGKVEIEDARKRAKDLQARKPEQLTAALLGELNAKIAKLETEIAAESSDR